MKQAAFVFTLLLVPLYSITAQALLVQSSEQSVQELAQEMIKQVQNPDENLGLLTEIQAALQPHLDFISNTLPKMQTDPEFEPYIEKYEALKGQYMDNGGPMSINSGVKVFLTASPFVLAPSYDGILQNSGLCLYEASLIVIDRGFWQYYENNDEIREAVLFHELGHCDLRQAHGYNYIMSMLWEDDLLNSQKIDWQAVYEEFFVMREQNKKMICSEENFHLYEQCDPSYREDIIYVEQNNNVTAYMWRDFFIRGIRNMFTHSKCLLLNSDGFACSSLL